MASILFIDFEVTTNQVDQKHSAPIIMIIAEYPYKLLLDQIAATLGAFILVSIRIRIRDRRYTEHEHWTLNIYMMWLCDKRKQTLHFDV